MAGQPKRRARREAALKAAAESNASAAGCERAESKTPASAESESIVGRPTLYTAELAAEICERLAEGKTLPAICRAPAMPSARTVRRWAADDPTDFGMRYDLARKLGAHAYFDEAVDTVRDAKSETASEVQLARVKAEALFKAAAKLDPDTYGDRQRIDMNMANLPDDLEQRWQQARAAEAAAREAVNGSTRH